MNDERQNIDETQIKEPEFNNIHEPYEALTENTFFRKVRVVLVILLIFSLGYAMFIFEKSIKYNQSTKIFNDTYSEQFKLEYERKINMPTQHKNDEIGVTFKLNQAWNQLNNPGHSLFDDIYQQIDSYDNNYKNCTISLITHSLSDVSFELLERLHDKNNQTVEVAIKYPEQTLVPYLSFPALLLSQYFDKEEELTESDVDHSVIKIVTYFSPYRVGIDNRYVFVLSNKNKNEKLQQDCIEDYLHLLKSLQISPNVAQITNQTNGILYITSRQEDDMNEIDTLYLEEFDLTPKIALEFDGSSSPNPVVYNNEIYFLKQNELNKLDPFTGALIPVLPMVVQDSQNRIQSLLFDTNGFYFLIGEYCLYYKATCDLSLRYYDEKTQIVSALAENITQRHLRFHDAKESIQITYEWRDAGCASGHSVIFNTINQNISTGPSYSGCYGVYENGFEKEIEQFSEEYFDVNAKNHIFIRNGKLFEPQANRSRAGWHFLFP